jgi:hypothetical protein
MQSNKYFITKMIFYYVNVNSCYLEQLCDLQVGVAVPCTALPGGDHLYQAL